MGQRFDMMSGLSPGFLRMGVTAASLSEWGVGVQTGGQERTGCCIVVYKIHYGLKE